MVKTRQVLLENFDEEVQEKLRMRAVRIVREAAGISDEAAAQALADAGGDVKAAIVSTLLGLAPDEARARLSDAQGRISSALFVQWVPEKLASSDWEAEVERYADHLLSLCDRFAPGTSALVVDRMALHPGRIAQHFGMTSGHIHHIDNSFGFTDRFPHRTPVAGLYSCSAGTHPAGSVIGSAGYIAAQRVLSDLFSFRAGGA